MAKKRNLALPAEYAVEHLLRTTLYKCVETWRVPPVKFRACDIFGADVVGRCEDGTKVWVQVTSSTHATNVSKRKRKMEPGPWHFSDTVLVLQLKRHKGDGDSFFFRVHVWARGNWWEDETIPVPDAWLKEYKEAE